MKNTLRKKDKLRLKSDFSHVKTNGIKYVGGSLLLISASSPDGHLRGGVICGKKYSNLAVKRNRARRLLWESFRLLRHQICRPAHLVMIPRKSIAAAAQQQVQEHLRILLQKAGLIPSENCRHHNWPS